MDIENRILSHTIVNRAGLEVCPSIKFSPTIWSKRGQKQGMIHRFRSQNANLSPQSRFPGQTPRPTLRGELTSSMSEGENEKVADLPGRERMSRVRHNGERDQDPIPSNAIHFAKALFRFRVDRTR